MILFTIAAVSALTIQELANSIKVDYQTAWFSNESGFGGRFILSSERNIDSSIAIQFLFPSPDVWITNHWGPFTLQRNEKGWHQSVLSNTEKLKKYVLEFNGIFPIGSDWRMQTPKAIILVVRGQGFKIPTPIANQPKGIPKNPFNAFLIKETDGNANIPINEMKTPILVIAIVAGVAVLSVGLLGVSTFEKYKRHQPNLAIIEPSNRVYRDDGLFRKDPDNDLSVQDYQNFCSKKRQSYSTEPMEQEEEMCNVPLDRVHFAMRNSSLPV